MEGCKGDAVAAPATPFQPQCMPLLHCTLSRTRPASCLPRGLQRWAGPDQAQALSLCEWLYHRVEPLQAFMPEPLKQAAAGGTRRQRHHT